MLTIFYPFGHGSWLVYLEIIPFKHPGSIQFKSTTPYLLSATQQVSIIHCCRNRILQSSYSLSSSHQHREVMWSKDYTTLSLFKKRRKKCSTCSLLSVNGTEVVDMLGFFFIIISPSRVATAPGSTRWMIVKVRFKMAASKSP